MFKVKLTYNFEKFKELKWQFTICGSFCRREMLKEFLDQHCMLINREAMSNANNEEEPSLSAYDFLYLPIDFVYVFTKWFTSLHTYIHTNMLYLQFYHFP